MQKYELFFDLMILGVQNNTETVLFFLKLPQSETETIVAPVAQQFVFCIQRACL